MSLVEKFVSAMQNTVSSVIEGSVPGLTVKVLDKMVIKEKELVLNSGTFIIIGLTGEIKGRIIYLLDPISSKKLAGKMLMEELAEHNEISLSALCELTNMVSGGAISSKEITEENIEISPPTLFQGDTVSVSSLKDEVHLLPFEFDGSKMLIFIAIDAGSIKK